MACPAQVLILIVKRKADCDALVDSVEKRIGELLPFGMNLDIWAMVDGDRYVAAVRSAKSEIYPVRVFETWWPFAH